MPPSHRIVPIKSEALAVPTSPPKLTYHNGHLLTSVEVYTIFWGTGWKQAPQNGLIPQLNGFFDYILTSPIMDLLNEYSVPGQTIGYGKRVGTNTITSSDPGTPNPGGGRTVTDSQIQQALQNWINNNTIPQPNKNTLFFVYLPPNVVSEIDNAGSCSSFCGYHSAINSSIFYAVMPYLDCAGCTSGQNVLDSLTEVSTHELCEAITDPDPTSGWNDDNISDGEIGDLCNFQAAQLGGYNVQTQWSNEANACLAGPAKTWHTGDLTAQASAPNASAGANLMSYLYPDQQTQHVFYHSDDGHIHELVWFPIGGWRTGDLTMATSAPPNASAGSNLTGYLFPSQQTQHVFYRGDDGHVHELWWSLLGGWHHGDLTAQAGAPNASIGANLTSYVYPDQQTQHVFYRSDDGHIHELLWQQGEGWHDTDLTTLTGAPSASAGSNLTGYLFTSQQTQHVFYRADDGHVHELWWSTSGGWKTADLTAQTAGPTVSTGSNLTCYIFTSQQTQHIFYRADDGHVHELWWPSNGGWVSADLTTQAGAPNASANTGLTSYIFTDQQTQHVFCRSDDGHIRELRWSSGGGWGRADPTALAGAPNASAGSNLTGYYFPNQQTKHVFYRSDDGHIHELWWGR